MQTLFKKIYAGILGIAILSVHVAPLLIPLKAHAQWATFDASNFAQNTITATKSVYSTGLLNSLQIKEFSLDAIAYGIAKQILRNITTSVVNWINSGFEGSPAFLTDPAQFFMDIGDEILGGMILGSDLAFLCSPFSIDIRLQLAFRYRPFARQRVACTLSDVIKNVTNAGETASINGFTAGDFRQGRMPAFVTMTTEPQNNWIGAYVEADYEASFRIANESARKADELSQGRGFLSFPVCKETRIISESEANRLSQRNSELAAAGQQTSEEFRQNTTQLQDYYESSSNETVKKKCEIQTPGSVIANTLETSLNAPVRELELADELNEIVNALFAQLIQKVLVGGLRGVSSQSTGGTASFAQQMQQQQALSNQQLQNLRSGILDTIDNFIYDAEMLKNTKNSTLGLVLGIRAGQEDVKTCYNSKISAPSQVLTPYAMSVALDKINSADATINSRITPVQSRLEFDVQVLVNEINNLYTIKESALAATQPNQLYELVTQYNSLIPTLHLYTEKNVQAGEEYSSISSSLEDVSRNSANELNNCKIFQH